MEIGIGLGITRFPGWGVMNIGQLFASGEQGAWYDPSDMSTLFQDSAGTVPVTAVEQPVGRILDKSGRGNHATQATTTKRPIYSRRVNLLTKTEQFDDAAWLTPPTGTVKSNNAGTDPLGGGTAGKVECAQDGVAVYIANSVALGLITGATYRATVHVRNGGGIPSITFYNGQYGAYKSATINLITGAVTGSNYTTPPVVSVSGDGWVSISVDIVAPDTYGNYCYIQSSATSAVGDHFFIWHPSLTLATDAHLPYQRVNTDTDYDADPNKFPAYLACDGIDDAMQTGNIDFTGTDKMTVWAGVDRTQGSTTGIIVESSTSSSANNGAFALLAHNTLGYEFSSRGTILSDTVFNSSPAASPSIVAASFDIGGGGVTRRVNSQQSVIAANQGTGQYGNYPLYIGARAGTGTYLNGRLYSLIVRGAQSSLSQIEAGELYTKQKMRLP